MKMKINIYRYLAAIVFLSLIVSSCGKFIEVPPPKSKAELSRVFADDQTAISATVGLYSSLVASNLNILNGGMTLYPAYSADELTTTASAATNPFILNALASDNTTVRSNFWNNPYKSIYHANAVIEGLDGSATLSPLLKKQLKGEVLFIRSLLYFYMVNLFGDVPLQMTTDYQINAVMPRTNSEKVYDQIVANLLNAKELLSESYPTSINTRPNKDAVSALLARIYLYQGKWNEAQSMASEVISSGKYHLDELNSVFVSTSRETIFQLSKQNGNTSEGLNFNPSSSTARPTYILTSYQLAAFEEGDNRKTSWIKSNTVSGTTYYYPYKYKIRANIPITEYYVVQRLAEIYLIRAEARAQLNNLSGAIDDIDMIRDRAGLTNALIKNTNPGINKTDLLDAVLKERQRELFVEWGNRWLDLKRLNKADEVLGIIKAPNWQPTDKLYPIPFLETQTNPFLTQNDGYTN